MKTSDLLMWGGLAVGGYFVYRWWQQRQTTAAALIGPTAVQNALTTGLQAGIAAGTYDANALRMQALGMPAPSLSNSVGLPPGALNGFR